MRAIYARSLDNAMAVGGKLPWHVPTDLLWFRAVTLGQTIVLGKNTFMALQDADITLDKRRIIIASRNPDQIDYKHERFSDVEVLSMRAILKDHPNAFVAGGPQLLYAFRHHLFTVHETTVKMVVGNPPGVYVSRLPPTWGFRNTVRPEWREPKQTKKDSHRITFRKYQSLTETSVIDTV